MKNKEQLEQKVKAAVQELYCAVSQSPETPFHFPTGKAAMRNVGYPEELIVSLPDVATESFAGVGYHFKNNAIQAGDQVLDIGSGSGSDLLIAADLAGPEGKVVGIDITAEMIEKSKKAVEEKQASNVVLQTGPADKLPFPDETFDVVISNGVINLIPDKQLAFNEIYRVLKPGGRLSVADIVLGNPISEESRENPKLWAECIVGAALEEDYLDLIRNAGFEEVEVTQNLDYFSFSPSSSTQEVAGHYKAHSVALQAKKPTK